MAVSAIGTAMTGKSKDNITKEFTSEERNFTAYVIQLDDDSNPTSNVTPYLNGFNDLKVTLKGTDKVFEDKIVFTSDNSDTEFTLNGIEPKTSKVEYAADSVDAVEIAVVFYVDKDAYDEIIKTGMITGELSMSSNIEVERVGFKYFSMVVGVLFVIFIIVTCVCIKEKSSVDMETASVGQMFKALVQNDQAMTIVLTIVLVNTATYITSNLLIYFFKYDLAGSNWQGNYTLFNTFAGGIQIIAMMAFFPLLRKAFNTLKIFYICVFSAIGGYIILLAMALSGTKNVFPFFVPGFFIMGAVGILNVIVTIFLANTVDYGEYKNKRRDESVIFSMQTFVVKLASGIAALVASICLTVFNIQENSDSEMTFQSLLDKVKDLKNNVVEKIDSSAVTGLRMVMTMTPIFVLIVALIVFRAKYKLTDEKLEEISNEIHKS
ncbi:MAG: MFS transporter [Eubacterium sp.]|nr:MFS transporter [Eubacterium sp.]